MAPLIPAIYENGMIRPLQPLSLSEGQALQIQIIVDESLMELQRIAQSLEVAGTVTPPSFAENVEPVSADQWQELTERLKSLPGKPLSELIIEERDIW
ncbi:MAG: antitoxin family protein [Leptolyngbyaceae cyanobacterium bins.302]|nr:antitoxin family protein [Leptolyngbyaceae cyanobacterium bins.302]